MLVPAVGFGAECKWLNGSAQCKYHDVIDKKQKSARKQNIRLIRRNEQVCVDLGRHEVAFEKIPARKRLQIKHGN
jgi:hypothetical protein